MFSGIAEPHHVVAAPGRNYYADSAQALILLPLKRKRLFASHMFSIGQLAVNSA
jgi:hypothetical protein